MMVRELVGGLYFGNKEMGINEQGLRYVKKPWNMTSYKLAVFLHQAFKWHKNVKKPAQHS